jgi:formylglycine-generating enzyme required for sulfatase activity
LPPFRKDDELDDTIPHGAAKWTARGPEILERRRELKKFLIQIFVLVILSQLASAAEQASKKSAASKEYPITGTKAGPMVLVPAGKFWMGCNDQLDKQCDDSERPYHKVYVDAFYIDKYDVTQSEYDQCISAEKCKDNRRYKGFSYDRQPVVGVKWDEAVAYCHWAGKRLPTEAEWEKAARGTDGRIFPWGNDIDASKANYNHGQDPYTARTSPVGSYPAGASPYGAMDMAGNAEQWIADWYGDRYYSNSPDANPKGPDMGTRRVTRGGEYSFEARGSRSSSRGWAYPSDRSNDIGFRCAKTP